MNKKLLRLLCVGVSVAILLCMTTIVSAAGLTTLYESAVQNTNSFCSDVKIGLAYEIEGTIYIPSLAAKDGAGNMRGVKFVLGQLADGCDIELWLGKNDVQINESSWHSGMPNRCEAHGLSGLEGRDLSFKITMNRGLVKFYLDGSEVYTFEDASFTPVAESEFGMNQWDSGFILKYIKIRGEGDGTQTPTHFTLLYQSNTTAENHVAPGVTTGNTYEVEATIHINALTTGEKGVKLVAGQCSGQDVELWIRSDGFQLNNWGAGVMHNASHSIGNLVGRDVNIKLIVAAGTYTLYVDGIEAYHYNNASLTVTPESMFWMDQWESGFILKSIRISGVASQSKPLQPANPSIPAQYSVLYESVTPMTNVVTPAVVTGAEFVVAGTIHIPSLAAKDGYGNMRGVKLILGQLSDGCDVELWIGKNEIQINESSWHTGMPFDSKAHGLSDLDGRDLALVVTMRNGTVTVCLDGFEVYTYTNPMYTPVNDSVFEMDQWDSGFTMKEIKLYGIPASIQNGNTDNEGSNTESEGSNTENEGDNAGDEDIDSGNQGNTPGNEGGTTENQGGNADNESGNAGNQGGTTENESGNGSDQEGSVEATQPEGEESLPTEEVTEPSDGSDETTSATEPPATEQPAIDETKTPEATVPNPIRPDKQGYSGNMGEVIAVVVVVAVVCLCAVAVTGYILLKKNVIRLVRISAAASAPATEEGSSEPDAT